MIVNWRNLAPALLLTVAAGVFGGVLAANIGLVGLAISLPVGVVAGAALGVYAPLHQIGGDPNE